MVLGIKGRPSSETPYQLFHSLLSPVALILELQNQSLAVFAAGASCYQWCPNKILYRLARFGASFKTGKTVRKREWRWWKSNVGLIKCPKQIDLIEWHLLVKTANNEKFEYSQPKALFLHPHFSEKNETVYLQLHLPCFRDNQSENNTWRASKLNQPA